MSKEKQTSISELGEFGLIDRLTKDIHLKNSSTKKGVGDDAAILDFGNKQVVLSTDLLTEGVHFNLMYVPLQHLGYKVRYVRNITDVGHLENDADAGEDKIAKKARLDQLEPMEVVQYYTNRYHKAMEALNVLPPSIEPHASGHILEQI